MPPTEPGQAQAQHVVDRRGLAASSLAQFQAIAEVIHANRSLALQAPRGLPDSRKLSALHCAKQCPAESSSILAPVSSNKVATWSSFPNVACT